MTVTIKAKLTNNVFPLNARAPQQPVASITLKNTIQADTSRRIDGLLDVIADNPGTPAGSTLVYDPSTDKYIVKLLDLDGGNF